MKLSGDYGDRGKWHHWGIKLVTQSVGYNVGTKEGHKQGHFSLSALIKYFLASNHISERINNLCVQVNLCYNFLVVKILNIFNYKHIGKNQFCSRSSWV